MYGMQTAKERLRRILAVLSRHHVPSWEALRLVSITSSTPKRRTVCTGAVLWYEVVGGACSTLFIFMSSFFDILRGTVD